MKLGKDELKAKINELIPDNDIAIQLLEDIEDSMQAVAEPDTSKIDELQAKYDDLQAKYKQRFLDGDAKEEKQEEKPELQEKEFVDVKEI